MNGAPVDWLDTDTALDDMVARYVELSAQIDELQGEQARIKAQLRALGIGQHPTALGVTISVSPTRRFSGKRAAIILPPSLLDLCKATVIDAKTAKAKLPPDIYAECMVDVGEPTVRIS